ncbi:MAG: hypothetical protein JW819_09585 [Candidatus Krumholzibacteriota bacterium]|nr:hypothetical protein [Candidatus Krumholzibacteriota bacterium]
MGACGAAVRRHLLFLATLLLAATAGGDEPPRRTTYVYPPFKHSLGLSRVGELELKLFLGPTARYANPQGLAAVKLADRDDGRTRRDDDELTLFGVNADLGQIVWNPSLTAVAKLGRVGSGTGELLRPRGIAADAAGRVVVADTGNRRLVLLQVAGRSLEWLRTVDAAGGAPFSPTDVALAGGMIWCTDWSGRILRFTRDGGWLGDWPLAARDGPLDGPLALAVQDRDEPWNHWRRFSLAVVDQDGQRLRLYDAGGRLSAERTLAELIAPPGRFGYPVLDLFGQVVVPDSVQGRLLKLDRRLRHLDVLTRIDGDARPLDHCNSLAIWRRFGQLFIVEARGGSYVWTGTDILAPAIAPLPGAREPGLELEYRLTEPSLFSVALRAGGRERTVVAERRRNAGLRRDWVPLPDSLPAGAELVLRATPTFSARKFHTAERCLHLPAGPVAWAGAAPDGAVAPDAVPADSVASRPGPPSDRPANAEMGP